jgi:hypothetical protein
VIFDVTERRTVCVGASSAEVDNLLFQDGATADSMATRLGIDRGPEGEPGWWMVAVSRLAALQRDARNRRGHDVVLGTLAHGRKRSPSFKKFICNTNKMD